MNYTELQLTVSPDYADILMAELAELGYESFVETDAGLNAYLPEADFDETALRPVVAKYAGQTAIAYQISSLEKRNWNAEWEQSYAPIEIGTDVRVRASFHAPDPRFRYELVINPKMSFGTGHHETTHMMLAQQLGIDHAGKTALDVGSGTGILAIMAVKLGATDVVAFDVEEWAVANARENADLNGCPHMRVFQGTINDLDANVVDGPEPSSPEPSSPERYNVVLANINRNVLLAEIPTYVARLQPGGVLVVSGFYETDAPDIEQCARQAGLTIRHRLTRNGWASLAFLNGA